MTGSQNRCTWKAGRCNGSTRSSPCGADRPPAAFGCDLVVTGGADSLAKVQPGRTHAVVNAHETVTGDFTRNPDFTFPGAALRRAIDDTLGDGHADFIDATELATALLGNSIATNMFMLGYAWQKGHVPVSEAAILRAIELNGVAVEANKEALLWGRRAAHDLDAVRRIARPEARKGPDVAATLDEAVERRVRFLEDYEGGALARRYRELVERVQRAEAKAAPGRDALTAAVAQAYFKLLAYKDEYEVARLYAESDFLKRLHRSFEGDFKLKFHLAPPILAKPDPDTGEPRKREFGPWMLTGFRLLAKLRFLRATPFDPFGYSAERKTERRLIAEYETVIDELLAGLTPENYELAVEIAALPQQIRGFGHIKLRNLETAKARESQLLAAFRSPAPQATAAE